MTMVSTSSIPSDIDEGIINSIPTITQKVQPLMFYETWPIGIGFGAHEDRAWRMVPMRIHHRGWPTIRLGAIGVGLCG